VLFRPPSFHCVHPVRPRSRAVYYWSPLSRLASASVWYRCFRPVRGHRALGTNRHHRKHSSPVSHAKT